MTAIIVCAIILALLVIGFAVTVINWQTQRLKEEQERELGKPKVRLE